jgi:hypothetical protein
MFGLRRSEYDALCQVVSEESSIPCDVWKSDHVRLLYNEYSSHLQRETKVAVLYLSFILTAMIPIPGDQVPDRDFLTLLAILYEKSKTWLERADDKLNFYLDCHDLFYDVKYKLERLIDRANEAGE